MLSRKKSPSAFFLISTFTLQILLISCDTSYDQALVKGIKIGYAVEAPYAFINPQGEITGESPETAKYIANIMGIKKIEWRQMEFGELIPSLEKHKIDIIAAGMFITPERAKRISFSEPSFHVQQSLLVLKNNPKNLHTYPLIQTNNSIRIAVLNDSIEASLLKSLGYTEMNILYVPDALTGKVAVETKIADGLALSSPSINWMEKNDSVHSTEAAAPFFQPETSSLRKTGYGAFGFRQEDKTLIAAWNTCLKRLLETSGHRKLVEPFGFSPLDAPGPTTTKEVIQ